MQQAARLSMVWVRSRRQSAPRQSTTKQKPVRSRRQVAKMADRWPRADALAAAMAPVGHPVRRMTTKRPV
jgi:hypothetical protein